MTRQRIGFVAVVFAAALLGALVGGNGAILAQVGGGNPAVPWHVTMFNTTDGTAFADFNAVFTSDGSVMSMVLPRRCMGGQGQAPAVGTWSVKAGMVEVKVVAKFYGTPKAIQQGNKIIGYDPAPIGGLVATFTGPAPTSNASSVSGTGTMLVTGDCVAEYGANVPFTWQAVPIGR